ncbi:MAG: hypothetical protein K0U41_04085, partial [Gammaproteobacteria bacterium]|nr:hypothetical protein [Gammaproteobacteria bacterium]
MLLNTKKPKNMNIKNIMILPYIVTHIVAKATKTMQTIKQAAIIAATAVLLVACAAGGGGGGSSAAGPSVSAFSHSSYTFASGLADSDSVPGVGDPNYSPTPVGQVYANDNRIKSLAATLIGITDPQEIVNLAEGTDYRVTFSLVADATRPNVGEYFSVNETSGVITVTNPYGEDSDLTFGDIRGFLNDNSINVKLTVTVTNPKDAEIPNTDRSVTVKILDSSATPQLTANGADAELVYAITSISSAGKSETDQPDTRSVDLTGELSGTRIESGTAVADFAFSTLVRGLSANDFTATTATPTDGVLAPPRNAFAATDIYNATHITQDLTVNVNISLNSDGSMYVAAPVSFSADTAFSLVDGDVSTA